MEDENSRASTVLSYLPEAQTIKQILNFRRLFQYIVRCIAEELYFSISNRITQYEATE
jgi:hypothetical protein